MEPFRFNVSAKPVVDEKRPAVIPLKVDPFSKAAKGNLWLKKWLKWLRPTVSHHHGVYVVLLVSFLTGAAAAQSWSIATTLVLICALAAFQAEYPFSLQLQNRRSWKPRYLMWGGVYGAIAIGIAASLYLQTPLLIWVYLGAIAALIIDTIAVLYRQQRSRVNELITFGAVCLSAPFAYVATTGTINSSIVALWLLNTLFFGSTIFTVKLRKPKTAALLPVIAYHVISAAVILGLYFMGWLGVFTALGFSIAIFKVLFILINKEWYCTVPIYRVAALETVCGMLFMAIAAIS
ncbi:MAG: YwiC-like family protein, partial [Cyanobacteria bacterium P01_F01_bin.153]